MSLDLVNGLFNNLKENKFVQNFMKELSNYFEKNTGKDIKISKESDTWNNLLAEDLEINDQKIISKYKDEMLIERANILQDYALDTENKGEMYYIYNINDNGKNEYILCNCEPSKSNQVITKKIEELPEDAGLGSVLRKNGEDFILDKDATKVISDKINSMIEDKINEQENYLDSKRIEGHIYEVDEKYSGRIWLYDLNDKLNGEGIEEIEFPKDLYETAQKGDKYIYRNSSYELYLEK